MRKNGLTYKTISKKKIIMKSRRVKEWQYNYLKEIDELRKQNIRFYFIDKILVS